jgi:hypothetical protein
MVMAERMPSGDAEKEIGKKLDLFTKGEDGFLVKDDEGSLSWFPFEKFTKIAMPNESVPEKLELISHDSRQFEAYLKAFTQDGHVPDNERQIIYRARKRLLQVCSDISKIIQIEIYGL